MNITRLAPRHGDQSIGRSTTTGSQHATCTKEHHIMQKAPTATVGCRTGFPAIMGPERDMKEVYIPERIPDSSPSSSPPSGTTPRQTRQPIPTAQRRR